MSQDRPQKRSRPPAVDLSMLPPNPRARRNSERFKVKAREKFQQQDVDAVTFAMVIRGNLEVAQRHLAEHRTASAQHSMKAIELMIDQWLEERRGDK